MDISGTLRSAGWCHVAGPVPPVVKEDLPMTCGPANTLIETLNERMQPATSARDGAPSGGKTTVPLRHYQSAERAKSSGNETECVRRLDAALKALK